MEKWHIFNRDNNPLRWEGSLAEFDDPESAQRFLKSYSEGQQIPYSEYCKIVGIYYKFNSIPYNPLEEKFPLNLTNKVVKFHENGLGSIVSI